MSNKEAVAILGCVEDWRAPLFNGAVHFKKRLPRAMHVTLGMCAWLLCVVLSTHADAVTRYVNSESSGAAKNPTRAFNAAGYTPNDSYATLSAAYNAAAAGDTIELSGGVSGKSYAGATISKANLRIAGSRISNHNGSVLLTPLNLTSDGITLQDLSISGSQNGYALRLRCQNCMVRNVSIEDLVRWSFCILHSPTLAGGINTFENVVMKGAGPNQWSRGVSLQWGIANFNHCIFNAIPTLVADVLPNATANFTNCAFTLMSSSFHFNAGGTVNTTNCLIQGVWRAAFTFTSGTGGTWNSTNDFRNVFPYYTRTQANMGFIALSSDDTQNLDYFTTNADYAMSTYGIPMTFFANYTSTLSADSKKKLQTLYKAGEEIGSHTRHHTSMDATYAFTITYSGGYSDLALVVSGGGTSLSVSGSGDTHGPIDLRPLTISSLCAQISKWTGFACTVNNSITATMTATILKDASTALARNAATMILFDDDPGPGNRYYVENISASISDLENAVHADPACASYTTKTLAFPSNSSSAALLAWIRANTPLWGARGSTVGTENQDTLDNELNLRNINVFKASVIAYPIVGGIKSSDYASLDSDHKRACIEQSARVMATYASNGYFPALITHNSTELTAQEFRWFVDELAKYRADYNIEINSYENIIHEITSSGTWTGAGDGIWTRTFSGADDFRPRNCSPMVDAGAAVPGRTTDMLGNPIYGAPDIGAYEFQPPYTAGTNGIPCTTPVRIYGDERFRDMGTRSSDCTADLSVTIPGDDRTQWLDVQISAWENDGARHKRWSVSAGTPAPEHTDYVVGDLVSGEYYCVRVNGVLGQNIPPGDYGNGIFKADSSGRISFSYSGAYGNIVFDVDRRPAPPTISFSPDTGTEGDHVTNARQLVLSGTASGADGFTVQVYDGETLLGQAVGSSAWTFLTPTLDYGLHSFTARTDAVSSAQLSVVVAKIVADAGARRANGGLPWNAKTGSGCQLDGSGSYDPDGGPIGYAWTFDGKPSGSALSDADIHDADTASPWFAPDTNGEYTLKLTALDSEEAGYDQTATVQIQSTPTNKVNAVVSPKEISTVVNTATRLEGACSKPQGVLYAWSATGPGRVSLSSEELSWTEFSADAPGDYSVSLAVSSGGFSATDHTVVHVVAGDPPPTANAGNDQFLTLNVGTDATQLEAFGSTPAGGTCSWAFVSYPGAEPPVLSGDACAPEFVPLAKGIYVLRLTYSTGSKSNADNVMVVVNNEIATPPLMGASAQAAIQRILAMGMTVGEISFVTSDTVPQGSVVSQSPIPGEYGPPGSAVNLVVAAKIDRTINLVQYNRRTGQSALSIVVTNADSVTLRAPITAVFAGLSAPLVSVANGTGLTPSGNVYFDLSAALRPEGIKPGESVAFQAVFNNPECERFTFATTIHAGG